MLWSPQNSAASCRAVRIRSRTSLRAAFACWVSDATSFYGNVNYDTSFNGNADAWEGKVGLKVQW